MRWNDVIRSFQGTRILSLWIAVTQLLALKYDSHWPSSAVTIADRYASQISCQNLYDLPKNLNNVNTTCWPSQMRTKRTEENWTKENYKFISNRGKSNRDEEKTFFISQIKFFVRKLNEKFSQFFSSASRENFRQQIGTQFANISEKTF